MHLIIEINKIINKLKFQILIIITNIFLKTKIMNIIIIDKYIKNCIQMHLFQNTKIQIKNKLKLKK